WWRGACSPRARRARPQGGGTGGAWTAVSHLAGRRTRVPARFPSAPLARRSGARQFVALDRSAAAPALLAAFALGAPAFLDDLPGSLPAAARQRGVAVRPELSPASLAASLADMRLS